MKLYKGEPKGLYDDILSAVDHFFFTNGIQALMEEMCGP